MIHKPFLNAPFILDRWSLFQRLFTRPLHANIPPCHFHYVANHRAEDFPACFGKHSMFYHSEGSLRSTRVCREPRFLVFNVRGTWSSPGSGCPLWRDGVCRPDATALQVSPPLIFISSLSVDSPHCSTAALSKRGTWACFLTRRKVTAIICSCVTMSTAEPG